VKFLVQLRADRSVATAGEPDLAGEVLDVCQEIVTDCTSAGLPSVIENLVYELPGEQLSGKAREDAIIDAATALDQLDIDLLKLEYPGSPDGCRRLADVLHRPWAVLSAGVPFAQFSDVLKIAFDEGGASGFIAGRSIWREALPLKGGERQGFLDNIARPRLDDLVAVANQRARPWTEATR
jgi:tagatose-1,6-bisphosphate aldolase